MATLHEVSSILLFCAFIGAAASTAPPTTTDQCRPCTRNDGAQCTHPGNANQQWCNANCPKGVNGAGCPASHCFCGTSVLRRCRPCTIEERPLGCTHPNVADQAFCDSICPRQVNDDICVISHCFCDDDGTAQQTVNAELPSVSMIPSESVVPSESLIPSESLVPSFSVIPSESLIPSESFIPSESVQPLCRPCTILDGAQCTHPGNADQQWCDDNCPDGVNGAGCPASHCFCGSSTPRHCRPCTANDPGCLFPGVADVSWCDARCPLQKNDGVCLLAFCFCDSNSITEQADGLKTFGRSMRVSSENIMRVQDLGDSLHRTYTDPSVNINFATGIVVVAIAAVVVAVVFVASLWRRRVAVRRVTSFAAHHDSTADLFAPASSEGDIP